MLPNSDPRLPVPSCRNNFTRPSIKPTQLSHARLPLTLPCCIFPLFVFPLIHPSLLTVPIRLEVIFTHIPIALIPIETAYRPLCSLLARVEVYGVLLVFELLFAAPVFVPLALGLRGVVCRRVGGGRGGCVRHWEFGSIAGGAIGVSSIGRKHAGVVARKYSVTQLTKVLRRPASSAQRE